MAYVETRDRSSTRRPAPRSVVRLAPRSEMTKSGTLAWFDEKKGYGFITPNEGGDDVFLHLRTVRLYRVNPLHLQMGTIINFKSEKSTSGRRPEAIALALEF